MQSSATYNNFTGNNVYGNDNNGFFIQAQFNTVSGNNITGNGLIGIGMGTSASNNNISGNKLEDNGGSGSSAGISVAGNTNSIVNNDITDSSGSGSAIAIISGGTSNYISGNRYSGVGAAGVSDLGTTTIFSGQITTAAQILLSSSSIIKANANSGITGTATATNSATLTGSGTLFTTQLQVGDRITVSGQQRTVTVIGGALSLTVDSIFTGTVSGAITRQPAALVVTTSAGTPTLTVNDTGNVTATGTYNSNTFTSNALTFGAASTATISSAATYGLNLTGSADSVWKTATTGTITIQAVSTDTQMILDNSGANYKTITVGMSNSTATLLVLDTKTTSGDPTGGTAGGMYYNSNTSQFRCYQAGTWKNCLGTLAATNIAVDTLNTTTGSDFATKYSIAANSCTPGRVFKITAQGTFGTKNAAGQLLTIKMSLIEPIGVTRIDLATSGAVTLTANLINSPIRLEGQITCITNSASGEVEANGVLRVFSNTNTLIASGEILMANTAKVTGIDFTKAQEIKIRSEWGASDVNNTVTFRQILIEDLGNDR